MSGSDPLKLGVRKCTRSTAKAILVEADGQDDLWIPQSQVHEDSEVWKAGDEGEVVVKRWWAEQNNLA